MSSFGTPIIVGVAQLTQRWGEGDCQKHPLALMADAASAALADTGVGDREMAKAIDRVMVVNTITWSYRDAPAVLAELLGIRNAALTYTTIGGNTPQYLANQAAAALQSGSCRAVLLAGADCGYSARQLHKHGVELGWPAMKEPAYMNGDGRTAISSPEFAYELALPAYVYPLFETALRAASGRGPREHSAYLGNLYQRLAAVAASNPLAWSAEDRSAHDISHPGTDNRYIGYPYTKLMNANMNVDQGAALLLTTDVEAARAGIDEDLWVYPMGGAHFDDIWHFSQRPRLDDSPALCKATRMSLERAGLELADISAFDIYSCFPSALQIGRNAIGLTEEDPRDMTVTGGLSFFGGPGNNYSMHAIAEAVARIRLDKDLKIMVSAVGWFITKHAVGIYGKQPPPSPWNDDGSQQIQSDIDAKALPPPVAEAEGTLTVEAFVIRHNRDGSAHKGVVVGRLEDGRRALAVLQATGEKLLDYEERELVGVRGRVRFDADSGHNRVVLDP